MFTERNHRSLFRPAHINHIVCSKILISASLWLLMHSESKDLEKEVAGR